MRKMIPVSRRTSCSVYGTKLVKRDGSVVTKSPLDVNAVEEIKALVFRYYAIPPSVQQHAWKAAVNAMNEYLRRKSLNVSDMELWQF